jgi:hypothetical protein
LIFFIFLNSNSNLNFGAGSYLKGYRYRTPAVGAVTAVSRAVTNGKKTLAGTPLQVPSPFPVSSAAPGTGKDVCCTGDR